MTEVSVSRGVTNSVTEKCKTIKTKIQNKPSFSYLLFINRWLHQASNSSHHLDYNDYLQNAPHYNAKKCLMKKNVGVFNEFILVLCLQLAFKVIFQEFIFRKQVTNLFTSGYCFGKAMPKTLMM